MLYVAAATSSLYAFDPDGTRVRVWQAGGAGRFRTGLAPRGLDFQTPIVRVVP